MIRQIKVFAVEKNPNAVVTLQHRKLEEWGDMVSQGKSRIKG